MSRQFVVKTRTLDEYGQERWLSQREVACEYYGAQIYGLFCHVPKTYVVLNKEIHDIGYYGIASHVIPGFQTLAEYLGLKEPHKSTAWKADPTIIAKLAMIRNLKGFLAGAILNRDWDCVGVNLSNLGVIQNEAGEYIIVKIDPGKASFFETVVQDEIFPLFEEYTSESVEGFRDLLATPSPGIASGVDERSHDLSNRLSATSDSSYCENPADSNTSEECCSLDSSHILKFLNIDKVCPNAKVVFQHLTLEDKYDIIRMICKVDENVLRDIFYHENTRYLLADEDKKIAVTTLCNRIEALRQQFPNAFEQSTVTLLPHKPYQGFVVKPLTEFAKTDKKIHDGRSKPSLFVKLKNEYVLIKRFRAYHHLITNENKKQVKGIANIKTVYDCKQILSTLQQNKLCSKKLASTYQLMIDDWYEYQFKQTMKHLLRTPNRHEAMVKLTSELRLQLQADLELTDLVVKLLSPFNVKSQPTANDCRDFAKIVANIDVVQLTRKSIDSLKGLSSETVVSAGCIIAYGEDHVDSQRSLRLS